MILPAPAPVSRGALHVLRPRRAPQGWRVQIALTEVAAVREEDGALCLGLDAFGDELEMKITCQAHERR